MIYGYARCSTNEERQDINRQKRELYTLGVTDEKYIYWEYESGMKDDRTEFNKLLDIVTEGDTVATTEVLLYFSTGLWILLIYKKSLCL